MKAKKYLMMMLRILGIPIFLVLLLLFIVFEWSCIPYPSKSDSGDGPRMCYSPNHEYYIRRYQTIADSMWNDNGTAIVYDKKGHEVYRGKANLSSLVGPPLWDSLDGGSVSMQGTDDWDTTLPSNPLKKPGIGEMGCY